MMCTGGVQYLSIVPLKIPALCRVRTPVYWWDKKILLSLDPPQMPLLVPCPLWTLSAIVIFSHTPLRPLVHHHWCLSPISSAVTRAPLIRRRCPLSHSHQCHSVIASHDLSAGCCHQIIASYLPPPSPLAHDAPLACCQSHCCLSSTTGGPPLTSVFITSCTPISPSLIHHYRLLAPLVCR